MKQASYRHIYWAFFGAFIALFTVAFATFGFATILSAEEGAVAEEAVEILETPQAETPEIAENEPVAEEVPEVDAPATPEVAQDEEETDETPEEEVSEEPETETQVETEEVLEEETTETETFSSNSSQNQKTNDMSSAAKTGDMCPNLNGDQETIPDGFELDGSGDCVPDDFVGSGIENFNKVTICKAIGSGEYEIASVNDFDIVLANQYPDAIIPPFVYQPYPNVAPINFTGQNWDAAGQELYNNDCVEVPPTDMCPNLPGEQTEIPEGHEIFSNGDCVMPKFGSIDICHANGDGTYTKINSSVSSTGGDGNLVEFVSDAVQNDPHVLHPDDIIPPFEISPYWSGIATEMPFPGLNWDEEGQALYNNDCQTEIVVDVCPNIPDVQTEVPDGYETDTNGDCVPVVEDMCPNIPGLQNPIPDGYIIDNNGDCVETTLVCRVLSNGTDTETVIILLSELDDYLANGFTEGPCDPGNGDDVCLNIDGIQSSVPDGYELNENNECVEVDICPNIDGIQTEIPEGLYVDEQGDCVGGTGGGNDDVCPNIPGDQLTVPDGYRIHGTTGICIPDDNGGGGSSSGNIPGGGGGTPDPQVLGAATDDTPAPQVLAQTGDSTAAMMTVLGIAGILFSLGTIALPGRKQKTVLEVVG